MAAHPLDRAVELEARPYRARPSAHSFLDRDVVLTCECCAAEPAEHNLLVVDDEAGVPAGGVHTRANAVEAVMTAGPSTVRPSITLAAIVERMQSQKLTSALVTRSDGRLVGVLRRTEAEAALNAETSDPSVSSKGREGQ